MEARITNAAESSVFGDKSLLNLKTVWLNSSNFFIKDSEKTMNCLFVQTC